MAHGFCRRARNFCTAVAFFYKRDAFSHIEGFPLLLYLWVVLVLCIFWHQSTLIQDKHQLISRKHTHARNKFTLQQTRRVLFSLHFVSARRPYIAAAFITCRKWSGCCFYRNWQEREIIINTITSLGMETDAGVVLIVLLCQSALTLCS
jgi:hypothetical protein